MRVTDKSYCLSVEGKETNFTVFLLGSSFVVYHHLASSYSADTGFRAVLGAGDVNNSKIPSLPSVLIFP